MHRLAAFAVFLSLALLTFVILTFKFLPNIETISNSREAQMIFSTKLRSARVMSTGISHRSNMVTRLNDFRNTTYTNVTLSPAEGGASYHLPMPHFIYGTAWKKERTASLVKLAIQSGFRGIDTACQPKHYNEPGVGLGLKDILNQGLATRSDLFLQTKFTPLSGQDPLKVPYDKTASLKVQVQQSMKASLSNLGVDYVDSLLLHSPLPTFEETMEVWRELESFCQQGAVHQIGISNCYDIRTLEALYQQATVKPTVVQNRFYKTSGFDVEIRDFCNRHAITYQSFWTLTASPDILNSDTVTKLAQKYNKTTAQIWFRFVMSIGITPLTGTTSQKHMTEDLDAASINLDETEISDIKKLLQ